MCNLLPFNLLLALDRAMVDPKQTTGKGTPSHIVICFFKLLSPGIFPPRYLPLVESVVRPRICLRLERKCHQPLAELSIDNVNTLRPRHIER